MTYLSVQVRASTTCSREHDLSVSVDDLCLLLDSLFPPQKASFEEQRLRTNYH